jgi:hypothetical protein
VRFIEKNLLKVFLSRITKLEKLKFNVTIMVAGGQEGWQWRKSNLRVILIYLAPFHGTLGFVGDLYSHNIRDFQIFWPEHY